MSEGELKKRILQYKAQHTLHGNIFLWKPDNLNELTKIIKEVTTDYPTEDNTQLPPNLLHYEKMLVLMSKRTVWFLKWFGEPTSE